MGSIGVKFFTVLGILLIYILILINWIIFILRLIGLFGNGNEATMKVTNPDPEAANQDKQSDGYNELNA